MLASNIKPGMMVKHSWEWCEVADVEISAPVVKVAVINGGRVAFMMNDKVEVESEDSEQVYEVVHEEAPAK